MPASRHGGNGRPARSGVRLRSERSVLRLQFQSRRENRFRPLRNAGQFTRFTYLALNQAKNKTGFRRRSSPGIGFFAVVIKQKLGQSRKHPDQIEPALSVSFTNFPFWNVVSAVRHPGAHARDVALDTVQTHVPNPDFNSFRERFVEKIGNSLSPSGVSKAKMSFSVIARSSNRLPSFQAALLASNCEIPGLADKMR